VAWFTDEICSKHYVGRLEKALQSELMIMSDEINNSCGINYDLLCNAGGKVWKINTFGATEIYAYFALLTIVLYKRLYNGQKPSTSRKVLHY